MDVAVYKWAELEEDNPIPLLTRRKVSGEKALVARVRLEKGCEVAMHSHVSEQMGVVVSGHLRWTIGGSSRKVFEMRGGEVIHLPSNVPHSVFALEDSEVFDILSPVGPMGVDSQRS